MGTRTPWRRPAEARPPARDAGRRDGRRDAGPHPLLPRRRDGARCSTSPTSSASRLPRSTTASRPTRSPNGSRRKASAERCGPTGGASRWRPTTASRRTSRSWTHRRTAARSCTPTQRKASSGSTRRPPRRMARGQRAGLDIPPERAIRWVTSNPARRSGIDDRVGTLEAGKLADVVVWNGDPFSVYALRRPRLRRRRTRLRPQGTAGEAGLRLPARASPP